MAWKRKNLQKIFTIFLLLFNKRSDFIVFIFVQNKTTPTKNAGVVLEKLI